MILLLTVGLLAGQIRVQGGEGTSRPAYRQIQPGEKRTEGMLERIGCPAGRPVLFDVRLKDGSVVRYQAAKLDSVDYISYGPSIRGVQCGVRRPSDHVYVTVRAGQAGGTVVAVEFLKE